MKTTFKWTLRLLISLGVLLLAGAGLGYYLASHSIPTYEAEWRLPEAPADIEIVRNNHAVPHIFSDSDLGVFYGLGFAHAQDRLWQMTMLRRVAQGRLAELFGESQVSNDHLLRALDLYGAAREAAEATSPRAMAELQAYADGVNGYLSLIQAEALGRGAPEFFLFEPSISLWTPVDSLAAAKVFALQLTDKAELEVLRATLLLRLPPERVADILPEAPKAVIDLPDYAAHLGVDPTMFADVTQGSSRSILPPIGHAGASNAFAAASSRAAAGAPLLGTDPHLSLTAPGPFYLARMELSTGGVIGATVPGLPAVYIGRNQNLAWGLTSSYIDNQDIYIERLSEGDPGRYDTPNGPEPFRVRDSVIRIAGDVPRTVQLSWTRHGPVIPAPHFNAASVTPAGHVAALAWTALDPDDRSVEGSLALMRAQNIDAALENLEYFVAPSMNLTLASSEGIALQAIGRAPARDPAHDSQGRFPAAGWVSQNDWQGALPPDEAPGVRDPEGGIVVNTNNRITDTAFPRHWSFDWGDAHRIARAEDLLNGREFHTLDSFIEVQTDTVSPAARALLPLIAQNLWYQDQPAPTDSAERLKQTALEALAEWSGDMSEHSFEPLVFAAWTRALQRRLIIDELGALAREFANPDPLFLERVFRDVDNASVWCDIVQSDAVETCQSIAEVALEDALLLLTETYGGRIDGWRWGAAHRATHRHPVLGDQPALSWLVNIVQETPGGDTTLLRGLSSGDGPLPHANVHASTFRAVVDFADPESSVFIASTGQSGHPLSRHYDDLSILWRRGEYIPMALDPSLARGGSVGVTRLLSSP
ncbi:MAG: penicillin acylase family protein [Pseudomonadota bacterium]